MATIHKFVYVMILIIFHFLVLTKGLDDPHCATDDDCKNVCVPPRVRQCLWSNCYCNVK
uniref:Nodule cysteine-rich protein 5 n=1 Tax=Cicer arietinum TaxID=3827 RepID=A0A0U8RBQ3_CICAR|nr:TPA_exp: nodule cysteine-rich protein 5 [Cicer arietinum]